ncbi:MAG TPA: Lar family restriction alleviation protein [Longimicrobium sp.]|nr:Lar family restriction alleviation protein [Longimicrobium sp.]
MLILEAMREAERATALLECPFCGGRAAFEAHPATPEIVRVACAGDECAVRPATEYLLEEFRGDLVRAWNLRAPRE